MQLSGSGRILRAELVKRRKFVLVAEYTVSKATTENAE